MYIPEGQEVRMLKETAIIFDTHFIDIIVVVNILGRSNKTYSKLQPNFKVNELRDDLLPANQ